jgi:hypothetical protein
MSRRAHRHRKSGRFGAGQAGPGRAFEQGVLGSILRRLIIQHRASRRAGERARSPLTPALVFPPRSHCSPVSTAPRTGSGLRST